MSTALIASGTGALPATPSKANAAYSTAFEHGEETWVLLVDARPLTRECVARSIKAYAQQFQVHAVAGVRDAVPVERVDLVLLSIGGASVSDAHVAADVETLRQTLPDAALIVLSDREDAGAIVEAIRRGARGYIPTTLELPLAVEALRYVKVGGTFVPSEVVSNVLVRLPTPTAEAAEGVEAEAGRLPLLNGFTRRELNVLELLQQGQSNKTIAHELKIQPSTVKIHIRHIMRKLGATNRTQAVFLAHKLVQG